MLSCETHESYIGLHEEHNTLNECTVHIGFSLFSSVSLTSRNEPALRERITPESAPRWQLLFYYFGCKRLVLSLNLQAWRSGDGVAENERRRLWGEESTCKGSWLGSDTCTCRRRRADDVPDPGCSWGPSCAVPLGSFSDRLPLQDRETPAVCWNHSGLLQHEVQQSLLKYAASRSRSATQHTNLHVYL